MSATLPAVLMASPPSRDTSLAASASAPSTSLTTDPTGEAACDHEPTVQGLQRQHGKTPRRRSVDDSRAVRGVESRRVTRAEQGLRRGVPHRNRAVLMRTDGRIRDDAGGRLRASLLGEVRRIEAHEYELVEQRSVAHDVRGRIHREGELLRPAERQVVGGDDLSGALAVGENEAITLSRSVGLL